jgi:hypothetical protein
MNRWLLTGLATLVMTVAACKDKNLECQLQCGEAFDKGKTECAEQDAACWDKFHQNHKTCTAACDDQFPK